MCNSTLFYLTFAIPGPSQSGFSKFTIRFGKWQTNLPLCQHFVKSVKNATWNSTPSNNFLHLWSLKYLWRKLLTKFFIQLARPFFSTITSHECTYVNYIKHTIHNSKWMKKNSLQSDTYKKFLCCLVLSIYLKKVSWQSNEKVLMQKLCKTMHNCFNYKQTLICWCQCRSFANNGIIFRSQYGLCASERHI